MGPETIGTLVAVAVLVGAVATYLIIIAYTLNKVSYTLGTILIGVRAIENQTEPVGRYVATVLNDVLAIDQAATQLLSWDKGSPNGQRAKEPARSGGRRSRGRRDAF